MPKPDDIEHTTPKPAARSDKAAVPSSKAGHTLQTPGYQKAQDPRADIASDPARRAVRRRPGQPTRGK